MRIYLLERMERDGIEYPSSGFYEVDFLLADELVASGKAYHATPDNVALPPEIAAPDSAVAELVGAATESEAP